MYIIPSLIKNGVLGNNPKKGSIFSCRQISTNSAISRSNSIFKILFWIFLVPSCLRLISRNKLNQDQHRKPFMGKPQSMWEIERFKKGNEINYSNNSSITARAINDLDFWRKFRLNQNIDLRQKFRFFRKISIFDKKSIIPLQVNLKNVGSAELKKGIWNYSNNSPITALATIHYQLRLLRGLYHHIEN